MTESIKHLMNYIRIERLWETSSLITDVKLVLFWDRVSYFFERVEYVTTLVLNSRPDRPRFRVGIVEKVDPISVDYDMLCRHYVS